MPRTTALVVGVIAVAAGTAPGHGLPLFFEPVPAGYQCRAADSAVLLQPGVITLRLGPDAVVVRFAGANSTRAPEGADPLPGLSNYFLGADPSGWRVGAPQFGSVRYRGLWPGIDAVFYGRQGRLEYDFIVAPGADPRAIALEFHGARRLRLNAGGDLVVQLPRAEVIQRRPAIYQQIGGTRRAVSGRAVIQNGRRVTLELAAYDRSHPLVIDPVLVFSSFLGGSGADFGGPVALDAAGNVYLAGSTLSANFPVVAPLQAVKQSGANPSDSLTQRDIFVAKINAAGTAVLWATYLGGNDYDDVRDLAVDSAGNVYLAGVTHSGNFPVANAFQSRFGGATLTSGLGGDAFVTKISASGSVLVYSTYLGGGLDDFANAIAVDAAGNAYVAGFTQSGNFPLEKPLQAVLRGSAGPGACRVSGGPPGTITVSFCNDAFIAKLNPAGNALVYSTFLGGSEDDKAFGIGIDATGNAVVSGVTASQDFPTANPWQPASAGGADAFVAKLNPAGSALVYATYLGGSSPEESAFVDVDAAGNAYVAGRTRSSNFPRISALFPAFRGGSADCFVMKLGPGGTPVYSTYLGGSGTDAPSEVVADAQGNVYVTGATDSLDFPVTASALQTANRGATDAFVAKLNPAGSALLYSSFIGGTDRDTGEGIAVGKQGEIYVSGTTSSADFPTARPFQARYAGPVPPSSPTGDAFLVKIELSEAALAASSSTLSFTATPGGPAPPAQEIQLTSGSAPVSFSVSSAGGNWLSVTPTSGTTPARLIITVNPAGLAAGVQNGTITITAAAANSPLAIPVQLTVSSAPAFAAAGIVNAASFLGGAVAPGEIVTIFGQGLGPDALAGLRLTPAGLVDTELAGTRVLFDGAPAPLIYVSSNQLSAVVPYSVAGKSSTQAQVERGGERSAPVAVPVAASAPAIFTADSSGKGNGAILNQDGTVNSAANPAERGSVIVIYATGEGETDPPGVDGQPAVSLFPKPRLAVSVKIGGAEAETLYAGAAPGFVAGVLQINARVPETIEPGNAAVVLTVGTASSRPEVTVAVR